MKLQIIVTHFEEPQGYVERFLDSIKVQDYIDKSDLEVLLINDGNKVLISEDLLKSYDFSIKYLVKDWGGLSAARQFGLENATADYIMFCDCDDMFLRIDSLYKIFAAINQNTFDLILGGRFQDIANRITTVSASRQLNTHEIHGKIYRRDFLVKHNISWDPNIILWHEDFYFNNLVLCENPNIGYIQSAIYLWKSRSDSISSMNNKDTTETDKRLVLLMDRYLILLNNLKNRTNKEFFNKKLIYIMLLIYDTYLTNPKLITEIEKYQKMLINNYAEDICNLSRAQIIATLKTLDINFVLKYNFAEKTFISWWSELNPKLAKLREIK